VTGGAPTLLNVAPADALIELTAFMSEAGEPAYRARQVLRHLWMNPAPTFDAMSDLPKPLRDKLAGRYALPRLVIDTAQQSSDGTRKFLFRLADGQAIEAVAIPEGKRLTLCISSQAGCALACAFCATGAMGFARNLEPFEIAGQVRELALLDPPIKPSNIVFMGMGEPLMNWNAVDVALTILNDPQGFGIGARHITVSTVGVLPGIVALSQRPEQFRLAISVHAPSDDLRRSLMPVNVKYPLAKVIEAAREFKRRVTFEYVMLGGVNDAIEHAMNLGRLARECGAFINLIPLHPGGTGNFVPSTPTALKRFTSELKRAGVEVAVRKSRGLDIAAACGQLRAERLRRRSPVGAKQHGDIQVA
jgi:23S rRNA (adenine2503-C2)-methyltransferase